MTDRGWRAIDGARASGLSSSVIGRWIAGQVEPSADNVRKFADALGIPILEALIAWGYITPQEAGQPPPAAVDLAEVPTQDLLDELKKRTQPPGCDPDESPRDTPRKPPWPIHAHQVLGTVQPVDRADVDDSPDQPQRRTRKAP
jgi:transcriptional regulator with XRE-family HTH domain